MTLQRNQTELGVDAAESAASWTRCLLDPTPCPDSLGFTPTTFKPGCAAEFTASPALWLTY